MNVMFSRRSVCLLAMIVLLALGATAPSQESLIRRLVQEDLFDWYQAQTPVQLDPSYAGAYVMQALGDELFIGLSAFVPTHDHNGPVLAAHDGASLRLITPLSEQDVNRMRVVGNALFIPGYDPNDGWDAGNLYRYDTQTGVFTRLRYRYSEPHFVDATTTDVNGQYRFSGLKPTSYIVRFVLPEGYSFTVRQALSNGVSDIERDSNPALDTGLYRICESGKNIPFQAIEAFADLTIDAGVVPAAANGAAPALAAEFAPDPAFYSGGMSIGDFVWRDADGNGLQDEGEPGLAGVRVELYTLDPYFPCVIHASGFWGDAETGTLYYNGGVIYSNITFVSYDFGETWQPLSQDGDFYWARDFVRFKGFFYKTHREVRYRTSIVIEAAALFSQDGVQWSRLQLPEMAEVTYEASAGKTGVLQPMAIDETNALIEFQDRLLILAAHGKAIYAVIGGEVYETVPVHGADLSGVLPGFNDPDFPVWTNEITGASNRYNTLANANNELLYAIGGDNVLYATPDLRQWYPVANFNTVGEGAPLISLAFWEERRWLVAATAGNTGSIYYLPHDDVMAGLPS